MQCILSHGDLNTVPVLKATRYNVQRWPTTSMESQSRFSIHPENGHTRNKTNHGSIWSGPRTPLSVQGLLVILVWAKRGRCDGPLMLLGQQVCVFWPPFLFFWEDIRGRHQLHAIYKPISCKYREIALQTLERISNGLRFFWMVGSLKRHHPKKSGDFWSVWNRVSSNWVVLQ